MFWHCNACGHDNEEVDTSCLICGSPKPVTVAPEKIPVCTLTATRAKSECNYADVTVPSKYNVIGEDAFKGRTDLYTIRIHSGVTKILRGAFDGCTNLYAVYVEGKLASIGPRAFAGCRYLSPDKRPTASTVSSDAFVGCSNINLGIPTRSVASSTAARKTTSGTSSTSRGTSGSSTSRGTSGSSTSRGSFGSSTSSGSFGSSTRPSPIGTTSFSKSSGTGTSTSSFSKAAGTRPAPPPPPPPPPPPKSSVPISSYTHTAPSTTTPTHTSDTTGFSVYAAIGLCALITVVFFAAAFLITNWGLHATWEAWQTTLGLAAVTFVGIFAHYCMREEKYKTIVISLSVTSGIALLNWLLGGGMTYLSVILAVGTAMLSIIFSFIAFDSGEDGYGKWTVMLAIANIIDIIALMIVYNYNVTGQLWQIIIALAILIFIATGVHIGCYDSDLGIPLSLSIIAVAVAGCLLWWFGSMLVHFVSLIALGFIGFSAICSAFSFYSEGDNALGVGFIMSGVASLALFFIANFVVA